MKYYFMDILACPVCKASGPDLLLYPIEVVEEEGNINIEKIKCKYYCAYQGTRPENVPREKCLECSKKRIRIGVIVCKKCGRWYPIIDEIPVMLDDKFRDEGLYRKFVREYLERIPENVRKLMREPDPESLE